MPTFLGLLMAVFLSNGAFAAGTYTKEEQLDARFYFDLGAAQVDTASYPAQQQQNYKEFAEHCSKCHTLARPINAPFVSRADWTRYVDRMHRRTKLKRGTEMSKEDIKKIVDFLVYDSHRRKIEHKADFDAETQRLKTLFDDVGKERLRLKEKENEQEARPTPMQMQGQPSPRS